MTYTTLALAFFCFAGHCPAGAESNAFATLKTLSKYSAFQRSRPLECGLRCACSWLEKKKQNTHEHAETKLVNTLLSNMYEKRLGPTFYLFPSFPTHVNCSADDGPGVTTMAISADRAKHAHTH